MSVILYENSIIHVSETSKGEEKEGNEGKVKVNMARMIFRMVLRRSGWSVRMKNVRYEYQ